jgi:hypothetical protein
MLGIHPVSHATQEISKMSSTLPGTDQDLTIKYYNRELTPEGVLRESSYEEKMLRRNGHVWSYRVLPGKTAANDTAHPNHEHKDFNYIVLPRHVKFGSNKVSVEFINTHDRQVINIVPTEYENVNFDGSWLNTYYLIDPKVVAAMPLSQRPAPVANTRWHEVLKNGLFQKVLWDEKLLLPLVIETGDQKNTFFQRITVSHNPKLTQDLPWSHLQGYAQKEYSDFLD